MPGLDYLGESYDPRSESYFGFNSFKPLAVELGAQFGASYLLKKNFTKKGLIYLAKGSNKEYMSALDEARVFTGASSTAEAGTFSDFNRIKQNVHKKTVREVSRRSRKFAKTLDKANKAFGVVGLGILAYQGTKYLFTSSRAFSMGTEEYEKSRYRNLYSGGDEYFDSRAAMTQRQRAIQVIHNSQMSTRAAFGNEASYMHY